MKNNSNMLKKCALFRNIKENEIEILLRCLTGREAEYDKNEYIVSYGDEFSEIGIILSGRAIIINEDFWGNRDILASVCESEMFGESFCCAENIKSPINVVAAEKTTVLFVDYKKVISTCTTTCDYHALLIHNMIRILANKNILLTKKINHISKRTTREKLVSYLSEQALMRESNEFEIPFNRQELADYLSVERSAMSSELCKMRDDGIISFHKSQFELH